MGDRSAIEWCDSTFNPWTGCTKISPACDHCYAESWSKRAGSKVGRWGAGAPRVRTSDANWRKPLGWDQMDVRIVDGVPMRFTGSSSYVGKPPHEIHAVPVHAVRSTKHSIGVAIPPEKWAAAPKWRRRVFCASLADVFDNEVHPQWRADLFALIRATPNLDWLLLTKRIGNASSMIADAISSLPRDAACGTGQSNHTPMAQWPWPNVWLGATICNQAEADRDIPKLLATPARVRFLSIEPMLGRVDLCEALGMWWNQAMGCFESLSDRFNPRGLHWVIAGGESGPHARPSHPDCFRSLRDQCAAAGVPFLFKQWGEWWEADSDARDEDTGDHVSIDADGINGAELWDPRTGSLVAIDGGRFTPETLPDDTPARLMVRIGKKAAGRMLDGREHSEFPA